MILVSHAVQKEEHEVGLKLFKTLDVHFHHPVFKHFEEGHPHVLTPIIHYLSQRGDTVNQEQFRISRTHNIFQSSQSHFPHFAVLVPQVFCQSIHCQLHEVAAFLREGLGKLAGKGTDFLLHLGVRVMSGSGECSTDSSEIWKELELILIETKF